MTTRWSVQREPMAITEFLLSGLRPEDALAFVRHLGSADPDLREADREVLAPVLTVTEGNPFLIKLVIRQYLATRRSLDRVMADLTGLGAAIPVPGWGAGCASTCTSARSRSSPTVAVKRWPRASWAPSASRTAGRRSDMRNS